MKRAWQDAYDRRMYEAVEDAMSDPAGLTHMMEDNMDAVGPGGVPDGVTAEADVTHLGADRTTNDNSTSSSNSEAKTKAK